MLKESSLTAGDETGARAERLKALRNYHPEGPGEFCAICLLQNELDRVTAKAHTADDAFGRACSAMSADIERLAAEAHAEREELDRVTAERERLQTAWEEHAAPEGDWDKLTDERDAAIASRNAWAEKADAAVTQAYRLREALEMVLLYHSGTHWDEAKSKRWERWTGSDDATTRNLCSQVRVVLSRLALAATDPIETIENPIDATEPKP